MTDPQNNTWEWRKGWDDAEAMYAEKITELRAALARAEAENAALLAALVAMVETYQYEASSENESLLQARAALARAVDERKG